MSQIVYLNGDYTKLENATVSVMDRGFLLGDGVYEVIALFKGKLFEKQAHYNRLRESLKKTNIHINLSDSNFDQIIETLVEKNSITDLMSIYIEITRGAMPERSHFYSGSCDPTIFIKINTIKPRNFSKGVSAIIRNDIRWHRSDIKSINRLANILLAQEAKELGAEECFIAHGEHVLEGTSSNIFIVKNSVVYTPPLSHGNLSGITRKLILTECQGLARIAVEPISTKQCFDADEVWLTSSSRGIVPVVKIDDTIIGSGEPGKTVEKFIAHYKQLIS